MRIIITFPPGAEIGKARDAAPGKICSKAQAIALGAENQSVTWQYQFGYYRRLSPMGAAAATMPPLSGTEWRKGVGYFEGERRVLWRAPHHCGRTNVTPTTQNPEREWQIGQGLGLRGTGAFLIRRRAIFIATSAWAS
jgi:hypothetical protein